MFNSKNPDNTIYKMINLLDFDYLAILISFLDLEIIQEEKERSKNKFSKIAFSSEISIL